MSESTPGTPAPEAGDAGSSSIEGQEMRLRAEAMTDDASVSDDEILQEGEPTGPGTAGDTLGGAEAPTGNDGTMGADAPSGDAGLADAPVSTGDDRVDLEDLP